MAGLDPAISVFNYHGVKMCMAGSTPDWDPRTATTALASVKVF